MVYFKFSSAGCSWLSVLMKLAFLGLFFGVALLLSLIFLPLAILASFIKIVFIFLGALFCIPFLVVMSLIFAATGFFKNNTSCRCGCRQH